MMSRACFFGLGLGLCLVGCVASSAADGLISVHKSTFTHLSDVGRQVAVVFDAGRYAVVADDGWDNRALYVVDLVDATEDRFPLDAAPLNLSELIYAGDAAYAIFSAGADVHEIAYRVTADGIAPTTYLQQVSYYTDERLAPGSDDLEPLLAAGVLTGLTEVVQEICRWDETVGAYRVAAEGRVHYFFNAAYLVKTNRSVAITALRAQTDVTLSDACVLHEPVAAGDYTFAFERWRDAGNPTASDAEGRILRARIYQQGVLVGEYDFSDVSAGARAEFYYWAAVQNGRLYFIGNHVKYVALPSYTQGD